MKERMMMLIGFASSAKTIIEYAKREPDGCLHVPREWLDALADYAEAATREREEG